ncbi:MAG: HAD family hydrolase [Methanosarcinales archaeon]|nr:HAD family hydrolase [Methanosarcinales archaeon]
MSSDQAVVLDVAGTMLRMYRVANDLLRGRLLTQIVTADLIMEKSGRALVVPQMDPAEIMARPPDLPLSSLLAGHEDGIEISCFSTEVSREEAISIIMRSRARIADIQKTHRAVKSRCPETYQTTGMIVDVDARDIPYIVSTGGEPFPGLSAVIRRLQMSGVEVHVASGDSMRSLVHLVEYGIHLDRINAVASPRRKQEVVLRLKKDHRRVVMVGDGLNDLYALQAADLGVLTVQQQTSPPQRLVEAADVVIEDIRDLPGLLTEQ